MMSDNDFGILDVFRTLWQQDDCYSEHGQCSRVLILLHLVFALAQQLTGNALHDAK
jgi:hypothetical protein